MTPSQYTAALSSLGMDNKAAAEWLGIGLRTQQRYAKNGPCGMASRAVGLALRVRNIRHSSNTMNEIYAINGVSVDWMDK